MRPAAAPPSTCAAKADVFSVSVHNVDIRSLLFAIARDARLNLTCTLTWLAR